MEELSLVHVDPDMKWEDRVSEVNRRYNAITQSRTNFALNYFVAGLHGDICPKTLYQILRELKAAQSEVNRMELEIEEADRSIDQWKDISAPQRITGQDGNIKFAFPDLEIQKCHNRISDLEGELASKRREYETLFQMMVALPEWTVEDMEKDEVRYWTQRFQHQMIEAFQSSRTGFDRGDLMSLRQLKISPIVDGIGKLESVPLPADAMALVGQLVNELTPSEDKAALGE